ncbi:MAG: nucleotide exchange factor GrpE [Myxococcota bacterium]
MAQDKILEDLKTDVGSIRQLVEQRLTDDEVRQKAFDQLYEELKAYKEDWQFQAEKPLLLDLLLFYDSLNWFQESLVKQEMSRDVVADSFQYLIDEFLELLYRRDVIPMDESTTFDRKLHKAVQVVDAERPSDDQTIEQVLKRGFHRGDRVLRAEEVVIRRHRSGG